MCGEHELIYCRRETEPSNVVRRQPCNDTHMMAKAPFDNATFASAQAPMIDMGDLTVEMLGFPANEYTLCGKESGRGSLDQNLSDQNILGRFACGCKIQVQLAQRVYDDLFVCLMLKGRRTMLEKHQTKSHVGIRTWICLPTCCQCSARCHQRSLLFPCFLVLSNAVAACNVPDPALLVCYTAHKGWLEVRIEDDCSGKLQQVLFTLEPYAQSQEHPSGATNVVPCLEAGFTSETTGKTHSLTNDLYERVAFLYNICCWTTSHPG